MSLNLTPKKSFKCYCNCVIRCWKPHQTWTSGSRDVDILVQNNEMPHISYNNLLHLKINIWEFRFICSIIITNHKLQIKDHVLTKNKNKKILSTALYNIHTFYFHHIHTVLMANIVDINTQYCWCKSYTWQLYLLQFKEMVWNIWITIYNYNKIIIAIYRVLCIPVLWLISFIAGK